MRGRRYPRRFDGPPPHWWPAGEAWPPPSLRAMRERRRALFVRRTGWFSFVPLWLLVWALASALGHGFGRGGVALLGISAAIAGFVALVLRGLAGPVADFVAATERIAQRDYDARVHVPEVGPAWLGDTARAFNAMAKELQMQDRARRHLMADIAHELRTPLAVVQGKLEGLIDGVYPRDDEQLQGLLDDTRILARLIDDLRTLSTAEGGALALAKEPTDVVALAHDVSASLGPRAADAGIDLRVEVAAGPEPVAIALDPLRIREVLVNLVTNALRYTPRGGRVQIGVGARGDGVEVRVSDTGAGISAEELPHIFDRFYKGAGSSGSGLGLTIARSLVEAHGGSIRAESLPGAGTTMVVFLPQ